MFSLVRLLLSCMLLLPSMSVSGAIYKVEYHHAQKPAEEVPVQPIYQKYLFEIHAATLVSIGNLKDAQQDTVSGILEGWRGGVWVPLSAFLALGVQLENMRANHQQTALLTPIRRKTGALVARWVITPHTEPHIYLLLGMGKTRYKTRFLVSRHTLDEDSTILLTGGGVQLPIWKSIYLFGEYQFQYDIKRWKNFVLTAPHGRHNIAAGLSYRF